MPFVSIFPQVFALGLGPINLYLIEGEAGLTLIDTGYEKSEAAIAAALRELGHRPSDVTNILVSHCHPDHAGSLAALKQVTGAPAWMHAADAEVVRGRASMSPAHVTPGWLNAILFQLVIKTAPGHVPTAIIEHELQDGQELPFAGGLRAIHTPGHSAGHMAFLFPQAGGLLFVGDGCSNVAGLDYSVVYDDFEEGRRSLRKLAQLEYAAVCFSHGQLLKGEGAARFRAKWA